MILSIKDRKEAREIIDATTYIEYKYDEPSFEYEEETEYRYQIVSIYAGPITDSKNPEINGCNETIASDVNIDFAKFACAARKGWPEALDEIDRLKKEIELLEDQILDLKVELKQEQSYVRH